MLSNVCLDCSINFTLNTNVLKNVNQIKITYFNLNLNKKKMTFSGSPSAHPFSFIITHNIQMNHTPLLLKLNSAGKLSDILYEENMNHFKIQMNINYCFGYRQ